jgi:hypothetical protein
MKIKKASEPLNIRTVSVLLYGEPGIGKTTLALTAPNPLLIDCESGIRRVDPRMRGDFVMVESWSDILDTTKEDLPYETIIIDTAGKALEYLAIALILKNEKLENRLTGGLTLQGYGALLSRFTGFVSDLQRRGKNVIFVSHMKELIEDERRMFRPDIIGRNLGSIIKVMDLVGYMYSRKNQREISFTPSDTFYAKNTAGLEDRLIVPNIEGTKLKPMTDIFDRFMKRQAEQDLIVADYNLLVILINEKMETIVDAETANAVVPELSTLEEIWDSKIIAREKLRQKTETLKLKYNKTKGKFV